MHITVIGQGNVGGFDPIYLGDLGQARLLESLIGLTMGIARGGLGPFFYRFNRPGELSIK